MKMTPKLNPAYWLCLSVASVFGADSGDFLADALGLGHVTGLPYLAAALAIVFAAEYYSKAGGYLFYWLAIIIIRAAATNVGDILHDAGIEFAWSVPALFVVLMALNSLQWIWRRGHGEAALVPASVPIDAFYWVTMFAAGTFGTVLGDCFSYALQFGNLYAAVILFAAVAGFLAVGLSGIQTELHYYWCTIALIRSAGTALGDFSSSNLTLTVSTAVWGLALLAVATWFYGLRGDNLNFQMPSGAGRAEPQLK